MKNNHEITLKQYAAYCKEQPLYLGTAGSYGMEMLTIIREGVWAEYDILAAFHPPVGAAVQVRVGANNQIGVPIEATAEKGMGEIVFAGYKEGVRQIAVDVLYKVAPSSGASGTEPAEPTPDVVQQIMLAANAAEKLAQSVRDDADVGKFTGAKGDKGDIGPTGPKGEQGPKGERGEKGDPGKDAVIDTTLTHAGEAADAAEVGKLKEDLNKQTEPTQGNIIPTNIYHGRYAYVVPEQMKLYLVESDNMTVSEYKLDANKKYAIKSSVENSVSYLAGCTATKMDTPSGKFGTPLDYTESFEASEKQKVIEFTYTPTEECYIYVNSYNIYPVSENGAVVIGEVKKPIVIRHEEELQILKANVKTNESKISELEKKNGYAQKKLLQPDFTFEGRTLYISDNHFYQSKENSNFIILGYKISAGSVYDIYGHSNYGQQAKDTLYVVTKTEMPTPSDRFGTDMEYTEYYNPPKQEDISHATFTAKIDGYLYIQKSTAYNFTQGVQQTVYVSSVEKLCPLANKKIVCFGDSIFGNFRDTNLDDVSIPKMIEKCTFASVYNCGFGGCRMAEHPISYWDAFGMHSIADSIASGDWSVQEQAIKDGVSAGAGYPFETYFAETLTMLKNINFEDIDIIVVAYGTNDFSGNITETQFKTALSHSIETILKAFPHLKILVVSPMWRWYESETVYIDSDTKTNSNGNTLVEFVDWCKAETDKYHLSYIDTYRNLGINKLNRLTYFAANDGTHPITAGRKLRANLISAELVRSCS